MFCHDIVFLQKLVFGEYVMLNMVKKCLKYRFLCKNRL